MPFEPAYITAFNNGSLDRKTDKTYDLLKNCCLCPRECKVDRTLDEKGICQTGKNSIVCSFNAHFGEERPLVGHNGSGTIFFSGCNLLCNFCQNYEISHEQQGQEIADNQLAYMMLNLQEQGCHNINFVTPSHVVPQILSALQIAIPQGLTIPLVYNTGGYDQIETLELLDGIIDIYMPDFKFTTSNAAVLSNVPQNYPDIVKKAIIEMHHQVGNLVTDDMGIAQKGLLIRHLVLPDDLAGTKEVMKFLADKISKNTYVNIMSQYRPCGTAYKIDELSRHISAEEFNDAIRIAKEQGITRLDKY